MMLRPRTSQREQTRLPLESRCTNTYGLSTTKVGSPE